MSIRLLLIGGLLLALFWLIRRLPQLETGQILRWLAMAAAIRSSSGESGPTPARMMFP